MKKTRPEWTWLLLGVTFIPAGILATIAMMWQMTFSRNGTNHPVGEVMVQAFWSVLFGAVFWVFGTMSLRIYFKQRREFRLKVIVASVENPKLQGEDCIEFTLVAREPLTQRNLRWPDQSVDLYFTADPTLIAKILSDFPRYKIEVQYDPKNPSYHFTAASTIEDYLERKYDPETSEADADEHDDDDYEREYRARLDAFERDGIARLD